MNQMNTKRTIGDVTSWSSGGTPNRAREDYWRGDIPWISAFTLKDSEISSSNQFLTSEAVTVGSKMAPIGATLLLVRGSALHSEIRAGMVVAPVAFNQDVKALVPKRGLVPKYLTHVIRGNESELLKLVTSSGNTAGVLDTKVVQSFEIYFPNQSEQIALVEMFDDVDRLVQTLERLLVKKKSIRHGMVQQLITGKTRLPGFHGEWRDVELGEVAKFSKGAGLPKSAINANGSTPCIHYGELFTHYGPEIERVTSMTTPTGRVVRSVNLDVLMPTSDVTPRGLAKASAIHGSGAILGGDILIIRLDDRQAFGPFIAHAIRQDANQVLQLVRGSTVFHLYASDMVNFSLSIPSVKEQRAIAQVLRDVDQEISTLHDRLAKVRDIKAGMMQELLTGRTRLQPVEAMA